MEVDLVRVMCNPHSKAAVSVEFSPSGEQLASSGSDKKVLIHRVADGSLITFSEDEHLAGINQVSWLSDDIIVTASDDGLVRIKNFVENKLLRVFRLPNQSIPYCFAIHPENGLITVGDTMGAVTSFHLHHGEVIQHFDAHGKGITSIRYSSRGEELITSSHDGTIRQWLPDPDPVCFQTIVPCPHVFTSISALQYTDTDDYIVVSTLDNTHRLFPRLLTPQERQRDAAVLRIYKGHINRKYSIPLIILSSYTMQRRYILSGCDKGQLHIWDLDTSQLLLNFPAHQGPVHGISVRSMLEPSEAIDADNSTDDITVTPHYEFLVATTGRDGQVKLWSFRPLSSGTTSQFLGPVATTSSNKTNHNHSSTNNDTNAILGGATENEEKGVENQTEDTGDVVDTAMDTDQHN